MLTPDARTVLLDDLRAPMGFATDHAVATTFTLDLTAAMLPPMAIADIGTAGRRPDPITLLQALRHASNKVDIFCQAGAIGVPRSADLVAFLEPMVHQVVVNNRLFHPKIWVMRFVADGAEPRYRLLVLSRNLSHDNTWDVAVRLDSESIDDDALEVNEPLAGLLHWLLESADIDAERADRVRALAEDVRRVHWERPDGVDNLSFHSVGLPGQPGLGLRAARHLVISPFVERSGLERATKGHTTTPVLISRQETLDALDEQDLHGIDAYTFAADVTLPETDDSGEEGSDSAIQLDGLHAKAYVLEPSGRSQRARMLLGSSNATLPGLTSNVEFMVEVEGHRERLGIDQILPPDAESRDGLRPLLEPYVRQDPRDREDDRLRRKLQRHLHAIASITHLISVSPDDGSTSSSFTASVSAERAYPTIDAQAKASIALLTRRESSADVNGHPVLRLSNIPLADITPCLVVTITMGDITESAIILGRLIGAPEGRLDAVIARQIDDPEKFMRLLMLMLSLGNPSQLAALLAERRGFGDGTTHIDIAASGVLELVLRGLGVEGSGIDDLDHLITAVLDDEVLPDGFKDFWAEVSKARALLSEDPR